MLELTHVKCFTLGTLAGIAMYELLLKCCKKFFKFPSKSSAFYSDCFFFTPKKVGCTSVCTEVNESNGKFQYAFPCNSCSLKNLISILRQAKSHLDICMYLITSDEICKTILDLFNKGVHVRLVMDKQMAQEACGAKILNFRQRYIPIKVIQSYNLMHNKFAVIDHEMIISGSVNWTKQGFTGNYENILVLRNKEIAKKYLDYFELLWTIEGV